ncbi:MAG: phosphoribosylpyrophosphate synthetase [Acidimicrobiales bacterium]
MHAPETVTEAVALLSELGYVENLDIERGCIVCASPDRAHALESAVVDHQFRFEGPSDPGDESIVLGVTLPEWGTKGVLVSAYGPDASIDKTEALLALTRRG